VGTCHHAIRISRDALVRSALMDEAEAYDTVRKTSGLRDRSEEGRLLVTGPDRATWLQGLLTNDIVALGPGDGCYAAYLTPQGRMISDLRVLALRSASGAEPDRSEGPESTTRLAGGDSMLLDVPAAQKATVLERLSAFIIMEDVAIEDVTDAIVRLAVHGPESPALVGAVVDVAAGPDLSSLAEHANLTARFRDHPIVVAGSRDLGVAGFDLYGPTSAKVDLANALIERGASPIGTAAWHTLRIEAGRPLFGIDMTPETIPLEAGIEDRAISFTKGCYVGQEIIIRVLHRGGGRVARKLVGLSAATSDGQLDARMPIVANGRPIGHVTSAARSPRLGRSIALGYVHRDFAEPGTPVTIGSADTSIGATVVPLPFRSPSPQTD
jgi:tRNA-modifying protein YgfZ